jgi:hypothetical protein
MRSLKDQKENAIAAYEALDLFTCIANERSYTLTLSPKKYVKDKPVEYYAIAQPHGANQKPIKGEGVTPEAAIFDLWEKLYG